MTSGDSLRFDVVDHVMLIVHADMPPEDADWQRMVIVRNSNRAKIRGSLVIAPSRASIDAAQRADVAAFMKATGVPIAVITDSALIRGVARAVGFLGVQVRAYPRTDMVSALNFLMISPSRHADVLRRIELLQAQLAGARPPATGTVR